MIQIGAYVGLCILQILTDAVPSLVARTNFFYIQRADGELQFVAGASPEIPNDAEQFLILARPPNSCWNITTQHPGGLLEPEPAKHHTGETIILIFAPWAGIKRWFNTTCSMTGWGIAAHCIPGLRRQHEFLNCRNRLFFFGQPKSYPLSISFLKPSFKNIQNVYLQFFLLLHILTQRTFMPHCKSNFISGKL